MPNNIDWLKGYYEVAVYENLAGKLEYVCWQLNGPANKSGTMRLSELIRTTDIKAWQSFFDRACGLR